MNPSETPHSLAAFQTYALELLAPDSRTFTETYIAQAKLEGYPDIHINPEQGLLLTWLATLINAQNILEVGTLGGYSGYWLLRDPKSEVPKSGISPQKRHLTTIEFRETQADFARRSFEAAGLSKQVDIYQGFAKDILPNLHGPFDIVFIDASKYEYPIYFEHALRLTQKGSLIIADDIWRDGAVAEHDTTLPAARGARQYNNLIADHPNIESCILPFWGFHGLDGMMISRVV